MKEKTIKIVVVERDKGPYVKVINNELSCLQAVVDGYIQVVPLGSIYLVCNEEGKLRGLAPTLYLDHDIIVGTCFFAKGDYDGNFISLTEEDIEYIEDSIGMGVSR